MRNAKFWTISLKINFEVKKLFLLSQSDFSFAPSSFGILPSALPQQNQLRYLFNRRFSSPHIRSGRSGGEQHLFPCKEEILDFPAFSLTGIPTKFFHLPTEMQDKLKILAAQGLRVRIPPAVRLSVSCKCCQVEISATGRFLVQGSPTDCVCVLFSVIR